MERRTFLKIGMAGGAALAWAPAMAFAPEPDLPAKLAALERVHGGRLGVAVCDTASGRTQGHRVDERFLLCSTAKLLLAGAVLERVDQGREQLARRLPIAPGDVLGHAPVTRQHVGAAGLSVAELCAAAITVSDNTAANLLLATLGGPAGLTAALRRWGDGVTRLDRNEPKLNVSEGPGDLRDTTTPIAMLATTRRLLLGEVLSPASRARLLNWMRACTTGADLLRAGLPGGWQVGDKTGRGAGGERNDVAIAMPPGRGPLLVAAYYVAPQGNDDAGPAVLSAVGRLVAAL